MDHIRNIQELIDENRESLPTALSVDVMRECQNAYETLPKLWKIYYIELVATGKNRITEEPKVVIVEEEPVRQVRYYWLDLIKSARSSADAGIALPAERMLAELLTLHEELTIQLRTDSEACAHRYKDAGTADFLTGLMVRHEKRAWLLRAQLETEEAEAS